MRLALIGLLISASGWGCKCKEQTSCAELGSAGSPMFVGTVLSVAEMTPGKAGDWPDYRKVRLRVRETFGGAAVGSEIEVRTGRGRGDCGVGFVAGEEYLVDVHRGQDGVMRASACSRTAPVRFAGASLAVLRERVAGRKTPSLAGVAGMVEKNGGRAAWQWTALGRAEVRVKSEAGVRMAKADEAGVFLLYDLPEGRYEFDPSGWQMPFRLGPRGCVEKNLTLDGREKRKVRVVPVGGGR